MRGGLNRFVSTAFLSALIACSAQRAPEPERLTRAAVAPPASSPLAKVEVGMTPREVENLVRPPTDETQYGKAFIPFYFGQDRWRRHTSIAGSGGLPSRAAAGSA